MTSYHNANMNYQNDCGLPITPHLASENSILMNRLHSVLPLEYSSPYRSHPIMNYYHSSISGSGGSSSHSSNRTRTPLTPLQLSPLVKVEEDVFVMDGVLVGQESGVRGGSEMFSSSSLSSGVGGSLYKTELCKSWEDAEYCRYGSKCQFAHGQEELRNNSNRVRSKKKMELSKSNPIPQSPSVVSTTLDDTPRTTPDTAASTSKLIKPSLPLPKNWSPMDDDIAVSLPGSTDEHPTRVDVDNYINNVLYGPLPTARKRMSAFRDFCPE